jgi:RNA-directed DNA polymerase
VRELQRKLWAAAKQSSGRRFHALYDRIHRVDVLWEAWERVRANRGAAGVDQQTVAAVEDFGVHRMLGELAAELRAGIYRPGPVRRVEIPKPDGRKRPLGIPTVRDRVVQTALRHVIEPIFEREFAGHSYGFRPGRGCKDALRRVDELLKAGATWVLDADLKSYFDTIDHRRLLRLLQERIADGRVLELIDAFLTQGVLEEIKGWQPTESGTPQGAVISPLLANIYLNGLDHKMAQAGYEMVRYADDFVILCQSRAQAHFIDDPGEPALLHGALVRFKHAARTGFAI